MQNKITKILMNTATVFITAYFIYCLIDPYKPRGMLKEQLIVWSLAFAVLVVMIIKIADNNKPNRKVAIQGLEEFRYPTVDKKLISVKPTGIIFGKYKHRYVCKRPDEDGHVIILGGSGSGKSSTVIIPMLLCNEDIGSFCIDIKGELSYKASDYTDSNTVIFNPLNRFSYGYDVFYALSDNSSSQELYEVVQNIVYSLISISASEKNPFWKNSARALLMGLMINYYKKGAKNFIDIIDLIAHKNTENQEYKLQNLYKLTFDMMSDEESREIFEDEYKDDDVYVLTNKTNLDGANVIASDRILKEVSEKIDSSFYVLPSSRHELILVPDKFNVDPKYLVQMVREVNLTLKQKDFLSDDIYYYNAKKRTLSIYSDAEKQEKSLSETIDKKHTMKH